ncbi:Xaa-Pro aminopeptidase [Scopulibacillus darangshiensis]|uniref:Xaa-Pro aminopeptidase n=2 Tax=Scopulibacillus darangshiensis TaxID=442528 RepID=A0A4R2NSL4_9BACL|nr:Xaa-Pro aminopeptidase [Scopulibacillus darangshiensis]
MKLAKLRTYLKKNDFDGILLRRRQNFSWLTGGRYNHIVQSVPEGVADLVVTQDNVYIVTSKMEERRILEEECQTLGFDVEVLSDDWIRDLTPLVEKIGKGKRMATDTPFKDWLAVNDALIPLRTVLNEEEINRYRSLCQDTARALESVCREILPGQTEHEIAAMLAGKIIEKGVHLQVLLVATDERIYNYRHPIPTDKRLEKHAMIVICAERHGLVANATRFVYFGEPPAELIENKNKLAMIDAVMNDATKPGKKICDVFKAGVAQYERAGFPDDWKKLHQGGLTGYDSREIIAVPETDVIIKANQAFAWNPSLPGIKSEDTILAKENASEFLTTTGEWPSIDVCIQGKVYKRPDILFRRMF